MSPQVEAARQLGFSEKFFDEMCRWIDPDGENTSAKTNHYRWSLKTRGEALRWCRTLAGLRRMDYEPLDRN